VATVQLFYNRSAGSHCPRRLSALRDGLEEQGARVILTECGPGRDPVLVAEASHVCAMGGDGTLRHVASALAEAGRPVPLSVYPAGTVNLLHLERSFLLDPEDHARRLLAGKAAPLHAAAVNGQTFLACASVGPDSRAVRGVSPALKARIGKLAYVAAFLRVLADWRRETIRLRWEGNELVCEAFYVAKGRYFAGPWSFAPAASVAEPLLHVVALKRARRLDFLAFAWRLWRGRPMAGAPNLIVFDCTALTAQADAPLPLQADGDAVAALPARFELRETPLALC
jgi:diacylglycerol kinase (ATP)